MPKAAWPALAPKRSRRILQYNATKGMPRAQALQPDV